MDAVAPPAAPAGDSPSRSRGDGLRGGRGRGQRRGRGGSLTEHQNGGSEHQHRGSGRRGGRGRGAFSTDVEQNAVSGGLDRLSLSSVQKKPQTGAEKAGNADGEVEVEAEVCFICASPVVHNSVAPCNHRTCHICALRMRALYKTKDCVHCRVCHPALFLSFFRDGSNLSRLQRTLSYLRTTPQNDTKTLQTQILRAQTRTMASDTRRLRSWKIQSCS